MSITKLSVKCSTCGGTGIEIIKGDPDISQTCTACNGDGLLDTGLIDTTSIEGKTDALQLSIDQVAGMVKEDSEYIRKIYEIVSKGIKHKPEC
jgi:DnaJ-class molecular chaperone